MLITCIFDLIKLKGDKNDDDEGRFDMSDGWGLREEEGRVCEPVAES